MFSIAKAQIVNCGPGFPPTAEEIAKGLTYHQCGGNEFVLLVQNVFQFGITLAGLAVTVSLVFAAFMYMTSGGSAEKLGKAKGAVTASIVGLVIALLAWVIVNSIVTVLVPQCKNWNVFEFSKTCGK